MVTDEEYLEAKKIVHEWLNAQPNDPKYPYKPKIMSTQDYARQRALNEIVRHFDTHDNISFEKFADILNRFDLAIFSAFNDKNENIIFIQELVTYELFTNKIIKHDCRQVVSLVNPLYHNGLME